MLKHKILNTNSPGCSMQWGICHQRLVREGERASSTVDCTVHVILILMIPHWIFCLAGVG